MYQFTALPEWKLYFVDYKSLKQFIRNNSGESDERLVDIFLKKLELEKAKIARFYNGKIEFCLNYLDSDLKVRVNALKSGQDADHAAKLELFMYAKKSLDDFDRELNLLAEYVKLNDVAFYKILKK